MGKQKRKRERKRGENKRETEKQREKDLKNVRLAEGSLLLPPSLRKRLGARLASVQVFALQHLHLSRGGLVVQARRPVYVSYLRLIDFCITQL